MKNVYLTFLGVVICLFLVTDPQLNAQNALNTDTVHKILTDLQCDSLIKARQEVYILDVRTPGEFVAGHLANAHALDYFDGDFDASINMLDRNTTYIVYCKNGSRSLPTYNKMIGMRFRELYTMTGGFDQWKADGLQYVTGVISGEQSVPGNNLHVYIARGELHIAFRVTDSKPRISVFNTNGMEMLQGPMTCTDSGISISRWPAGVYYVKVEGRNGAEMCKFVKQ